MMDETILICEDSLEGILTGVYEAYALRRPHSAIHLQVTEIENYRLFAAYQEVKADPEKSEKVLRTVYHRLGERSYTHICQALVSSDPQKADAAYHMIVVGLSGCYKGDLMEHLSDPYVNKIFCLSRSTWVEIDHMYGFLRFAELQGGILLAKYSPKNDITALIMPHFADRLPNEDFAVYDIQRHYYAVHPKTQRWYLVRGDLPFMEGEEQYAEEEAVYQALFRHFCQTISIKERRNLELQRNMLPLRFRKNMTEFCSPGGR